MKTLDLSDVLQNIPWAVVGGVATRTYMPERATLDLDILIHERNSKRVASALKNSGFEYQNKLLIGGSTWKSHDGRMLNVIENDEAWVDEALLSLEVDPQGLPVLRLPYLVLMKFQASRTQDLADISRMLGGADEKEISKVRSVVGIFLPDAADDLESLIQLGKLERRKER